MAVEIKNSTVDSIKKDKVETWSQTIEKDGMTQRVSVEKLYNQGYLITINKYGQDSKGKYQDYSRKLYSDTNPLDSNESDNPIDKLFKTLSTKK
jgi:hypothetical protein